jgi:uncharacterized membrane protein
MDGKTKAIVSHVTFIGLIVALILNSSEKDENASFYIRQQLGLTLAVVGYSILSSIVGFILAFIPIIGWILGFLLGLLSFVIFVGAFVFWIISLIGAIENTTKPLPWVGLYFQDWFKAL